MSRITGRRLASTDHSDVARFRRRLAHAGSLLLVACAREPVAPNHAPGNSPVQTATHAARVEAALPGAVATLLDSFSIGGVYTVLPRGGYFGGSSYARSPEKEQYAGTVSRHPTGLELPVGLPVRILAEGSYTSRQTSAFQQGYCASPSHATDPLCGVAAFTYTVHGLANGPGVLRPYEPGLGLALTWSRSAGYYEQFYDIFPVAEFFRGRVPALDTAAVRELHFRRSGCCYYIPWGTTAAWETYEGHWRFGAVPDDGGQAELGVPPVLRLRGPRTDAPMAAPATFTVTAATGDSMAATRWWYVRAANNAFDGEPVPLVTITQPFTLQIPRYPDGQRTVVTELPACIGRTTCTYQASVAGALVVQATLTDGRVLAARNTGASGAHVKITADESTLRYGDTTVFRVTVPEAPGRGVEVLGFSFTPAAPATGALLRVAREDAALLGVAPGSPAPRTSGGTAASVRATAIGRTEAPQHAGARRPVHFRDAEVSCAGATTDICFGAPQMTGYEVVTAVVDGDVQRDSVLVTVVPALRLRCSDTRGLSDSLGGVTVVRADTVTCRASISEGPLAVTGWSFSSTGHPFELSRSGIEDSTYARDSATWSGPLFTSGRVTVSGRAGGVAQSVSAMVVVTPRRWDTRWVDSTRWNLEEVPHPYGDPPKSDSELGQNIQAARRDYASSYVSIGQGPNQGLLAFKRFPFTLSFSVSVNYDAMRVGSRFYDMQPRSATDGYCSAITMVNSLTMVKVHEGFAPVDTIGPRLSHTFNFKRWFRKTLNDSIETMIDSEIDRFYERIESMRRWGESVAADSSNAITHRRERNPFILPCRFNYDPAVRFR